jgi:imidazolonepropionase
MNGNIVIRNCNIATPIGASALKGGDMCNLLTISDGVIVITHGVIEYVGTAENAPQPDSGKEYTEIDAHGNAVLPGFIDSHTHLIFGGYRADEFGWRLKGDTYMSVMERGGGIQSTVNATREATADELKSKALFYLNRMTEMGVTTVEAKSGYGLNSECELKMLDVINDLADDKESKLRIISTFLGAHAVPKEYAGRTSEYVDIIIDEMLPKAKGKAKFCDIFTEKNVFEIDDSRRLLKAAREAGFEIKLHADEIVQLGGAELAAELHATSADHLLHVSDEGIDKMRDAGVVATLLPLTAFALKESFAPARKIIDRGGAVALATDLNPGSCFSGSIPLSIALACIHMNMSVEETITALTLNGAAALGIANETGSLEKGKSGDVIILNFDTYHALPYYVGMNCVKTVIYKGNVVAENN